MQKWEIENRIQELQIKLDFLTEKVESNQYSQYGTDVKYEYETRNRGSKSEIESVKREIADLERQLKQIYEYQEQQKKKPESKFTSYDYEKQKNAEEKSRKKESETTRLETFKQVKQAYKRTKGHGFRKLADRIFGNSPKWDKVKKYPQEELDYVLKTLQGDTQLRRRDISRIEEKNLPFKEAQANIKSGNWRKFTKMLNSPYQLKSSMEAEETFEKSGRSL